MQLFSFLLVLSFTFIYWNLVFIISSCIPSRNKFSHLGIWGDFCFQQHVYSIFHYMARSLGMFYKIKWHIRAHRVNFFLVPLHVTCKLLQCQKGFLFVTVQYLYCSNLCFLKLFRLLSLINQKKKDYII
jgi:hypothetical protein